MHKPLDAREGGSQCHTHYFPSTMTLHTASGCRGGAMFGIFSTNSFLSPKLATATPFLELTLCQKSVD